MTLKHYIATIILAALFITFLVWIIPNKSDFTNKTTRDDLICIKDFIEKFIINKVPTTIPPKTRAARGSRKRKDQAESNQKQECSYCYS